MSLEDLFGQLTRAASITNELESHLGRSYGYVLGTVVSEDDRKDPLGLGRIRVTTASKGAKTKSDWLMRAEPMPGLHLPVPKVGDTVAIGYLDGDPHKGVYFGVAQNKINPAWREELDGLRLQVGQATLMIYPDGRMEITGLTTARAVGDTRFTFEFPEIRLEAEDQITLESPTIALRKADSVYINAAGKQVTTLGEVDSDGDTAVSTGWTPHSATP